MAQRQVVPKPEPAAPAPLLRVVKEWNDAKADGLFHGGFETGPILITGTNLEIRHGLGRVPRRWENLGGNAGVVVFSDTPHPQPREFIYLRASGTVFANILIS